MNRTVKTYFPDSEGTVPVSTWFLHWLLQPGVLPLRYRQLVVRA